MSVHQKGKDKQGKVTSKPGERSLESIMKHECSWSHRHNLLPVPVPVLKRLYGPIRNCALCPWEQIAPPRAPAVLSASMGPLSAMIKGKKLRALWSSGPSLLLCPQAACGAHLPQRPQPERSFRYKTKELN